MTTEQPTPTEPTAPTAQTVPTEQTVPTDQLTRAETGQAATAADDPAALRADRDRTRAELGETVDALTAKLDVRSRAMAKASQLGAATKLKAVDVTHKATDMTHKAADATAPAVHKAVEVTEPVRQKAAAVAAPAVHKAAAVAAPAMHKAAEATEPARQKAAAVTAPAVHKAVEVTEPARRKAAELTAQLDERTDGKLTGTAQAVRRRPKAAVAAAGAAVALTSWALIRRS